MRWIVVLVVVAMATAVAAKEPAGKGKAKPGAARSKTTAAGGKKRVDGAGTMEAAAAAFPKFCEEWMEKLAQRERINITGIKWQPSSVGVRGVYTGYSREHSCLTKTGTDNVPVGRITYMELQYEKEGKSESEAAKSPPRAVETVEVTEIFRYGGGQWLY